MTLFKHNIQATRRTQLDRLFRGIRKDPLPRPKNGWVAEIRNALQMTTIQLAKRLGVSQPVISNFEKAERNNSITLKSLARLADALDCDLHYVLVPRRGLDDILMERAKAVVDREEKSLEHHMSLEGQGSGANTRRDVMAAWLVQSRDRRLWEDE